jgi:hypothetical protein
MKLSKRPRAGKRGLFTIVVLLAGVAIQFISPEIKNPPATEKLIALKGAEPKNINENIINHQDRINLILDLSPPVFP